MMGETKSRRSLNHLPLAQRECKSLIIGQRVTAPIEKHQRCFAGRIVRPFSDRSPSGVYEA